jgi:DNA-binding GntR family transcriptional regulator
MEELKNRAYQSLRYRIITHDLRPGQPLNEKELMEQYQIGRTPLREVLLRLQRDGLIQRFPRSGTFVTPLDFHLFRQVIEIRTTLEPFAAQLAAERITESQLDALRQILREAEELAGEENVDLDALTQREFGFHGAVYEAAHNQKLKDILHELHGISTRFWYYLVFDRQELLDQFSDLRKVMDALEKKDSQRAGEAIANHIQNFVDKVRDKIL